MVMSSLLSHVLEIRRLKLKRISAEKLTSKTNKRTKISNRNAHEAEETSDAERTKHAGTKQERNRKGKEKR